MKKLLTVLLLLPLCGWAQTAPDTAFAYVSALQPPAWMVMKDQRTALGSSSPVPTGATLVTGPGARVHVALADGSLIKLGENTTLSLSTLQLRSAKPNDVLAATLRLSAGSLRYTTSKAQGSIRNELTLQVGTALSAKTTTADLFADITSEAQRLTLLDGKLELTPTQKPAVTMAQPNTVYTAYRKTKASADGVSTAATGSIALTGVEFDSRHPALQSNGPFRIVLALYAENEIARERVRLYTEMGYPVELQKPTAAFPTYRVVLDGLSNESDAKNFAELLKQRLKVVNPRIESLMPATP